MLIETDNLISVTNYALKIKKSRAWVDKLVRDGKITCIKIDCFKFIVLEKKRKQDYGKYSCIYKKYFIYLQYKFII